jgi:hypothetical protein
MADPAVGRKVYPALLGSGASLIDAIRLENRSQRTVPAAFRVVSRGNSANGGKRVPNGLWLHG